MSGFDVLMLDDFFVKNEKELKFSNRKVKQESKASLFLIN